MVAIPRLSAEDLALMAKFGFEDLNHDRCLDQFHDGQGNSLFGAIAGLSIDDASDTIDTVDIKFIRQALDENPDLEYFATADPSKTLDQKGHPIQKQGIFHMAQLDCVKEKLPEMIQKVNDAYKKKHPYLTSWFNYSPEMTFNDLAASTDPVATWMWNAMESAALFTRQVTLKNPIDQNSDVSDNVTALYNSVQDAAWTWLRP